MSVVVVGAGLGLAAALRLQGAGLASGRAVRLAGIIYREILREIERDGYGRVPRPAVVARPRKLALVARRGVLAR